LLSRELQAYLIILDETHTPVSLSRMTSLWTLSISFIAGACAGSFFYTLARRYAAGEIKENPWKALFSRSSCPSCKNPIPPLLLIPIIGYVITRGRCGHCAGKISIHYPLAEIAYGLLAALFCGKMGITVISTLLFLIACIALCIAMVDISSLFIPDSLVIAFTLFSIYPVILSGDIADHGLGILVMAAVFGLVLVIFPGSFGFGDVKFASAIGFFSGLEHSLVVLEVALISGALFGVAYAAVKKTGLRVKIPFAPFLSLGLIVSMLWGREILLIYFRMLL